MISGTRAEDYGITSTTEKIRSGGALNVSPEPMPELWFRRHRIESPGGCGMSAGPKSNLQGSRIAAGLGGGSGGEHRPEGIKADGDGETLQLNSLLSPTLQNKNFKVNSHHSKLFIELPSRPASSPPPPVPR
ncbi:hypothetical protein MTP99_011766 [Tenebrio molitor]|nr:hypothetical protein MTP99_011766 [Tenebrio molitor]